jgi:hypothetical protein
MGFVAAQPVRSGQATTELAQACQDFLGSGVARNQEASAIGGLELDLVAFPQAKLANKIGREAHGERITPFCNLHPDPHNGSRYTSVNVYLPDARFKGASSGGLPALVAIRHTGLAPVSPDNQAVPV